MFAAVSALIALTLLLSPPPSEAPAEAPVEAPAEAPAEQPAEVEAETQAPAPVEPPPPTLTPTVTPQPEPESPAAVFEEEEAEEEDDDVGDPYPVRNFADMPHGATAARMSAERRNNAVLVRPFRQPTYSITAYGRFGTLLSGGADVVQPFGYGFAAALRLYFAPVVKSRFGVEIHAGHTRFPERQDFPTIDGEATITRASLLSDTDFSAGPSFEIPLGPVFLQVGGSAGVALSTLFRPVSADSTEDQLVSTANAMLRGGLALGVPLFNQHGLSVGAAVHHIFSPRTVPIDPLMSMGDTTRPFGTWLEVALGYQIWF